jgi:plasmid maintenance system antidote protein VapI
MALRLSKVFGRTPEGWLRLQLQFDLGKAEKRVDVVSYREGMNRFLKKRIDAEAVYV